MSSKKKDTLDEIMDIAESGETDKVLGALQEAVELLSEKDKMHVLDYLIAFDKDEDDSDEES